LSRAKKINKNAQTGISVVVRGNATEIHHHSSRVPNLTILDQDSS